MDLTCEERPSDSSFVQTVWQSRSDVGGSFISMAESQCSLVVTRYRGRAFLTLRGPSTAATPAFNPPDAEFSGIVFNPGVFMPHLPAGMVSEGHDLGLPEASGDSFWLQGAAWQYPDFENADTFVNRLAQAGLLVRDPIVAAVLQGQPVDLSLRTVHRRFLHATGLTYGALYQIERARVATSLLKSGVSILDAVYQAGYFDQPHLTRSLKRYIGLTPSQIGDQQGRQPLSFLYKKTPASLDYNKAKEYELRPK